MTYCLRVCTVKYLPSFVCLLALECYCSFHLLATYISSFWPAWSAFSFFFWLSHFLFPMTSWMFLFRLKAAIGSFLKISLRFSITFKIYIYISFKIYIYIYIYIYILGEWRKWPIQSIHAGQLWTENFKLQYLLNPIYHYKAANLKFSKMYKKAEFFNWIYVKIATFFQNIPKLWWPS